MAHNVSLVDLPDIRLVVCRAEVFPEDIKGAWQRLESKLDSLKGRKFYGLTYVEESGLAYYAALEPLDDAEVVALGYPTRVLKGGKYARVKLPDWEQHADEIAPIFEELMERYHKDPQGPSVEFYRSQAELLLMIPVLD